MEYTHAPSGYNHLDLDTYPDLDQYQCEVCESTTPHRLIVESPNEGGGEKMSAKKVLTVITAAVLAVVATKIIRRA
ncbi:hypothetical protein KC853_01700 [Candidatus Saccharibacteria bacterium]|nr:hypothetical protein [Candidatus Saccharibacteria bacterium]